MLVQQQQTTRSPGKAGRKLSRPGHQREDPDLLSSPPKSFSEGNGAAAQAGTLVAASAQAQQGGVSGGGWRTQGPGLLGTLAASGGCWFGSAGAHRNSACSSIAGVP